MKLNLCLKKKKRAEEVEVERRGELDKSCYCNGIFPQFNLIPVFHLQPSHYMQTGSDSLQH